MTTPGWYQDPYPGGEQQLRYFDGQVWTADVSTSPAPPTAAEEHPRVGSPPTPPPPSQAVSGDPGAAPGWYGPPAQDAPGGQGTTPGWLRPAVVVPVAALFALLGLGLVAALITATSYQHNESYSFAQLMDFCDDGEMRACDRAYWDSPLGSEAELFGGTCGGRLTIGHGPGYDIQIGDPYGPQGQCTDLFGENYGFLDRFKH